MRVFGIKIAVVPIVTSLRICILDDYKNFHDIKRYVRIKDESDPRFVEFDFAIGHPELFVELILPRDAFAIFCENNNVIHMDKETIKKIDLESKKWRYGDK